MATARAKARSVFSGASNASPRCANTRGLAGERKVSGGLLGRGRLATEETRTDSLERFGELRRDYPHLVGVTLGELGKGLEVLVGQQLRVRVSRVNGAEDRRDRFSLALSPKHLRLRLSLGLEDGRLASTLRGQNR